MSGADERVQSALYCCHSQQYLSDQNDEAECRKLENSPLIPESGPGQNGCSKDKEANHQGEQPVRPFH